MGVEIHGLAELEHMLVDVIPDAVARSLEPAAVGATEPILEMAGHMAPRANDGGTVLAESMVHEVAERTRTSVLVEGGPNERIWYAHFPEFGTTHSAAQPYLRPAFDQGQREATQRAVEEIREAVQGALR